MAQVAYPKVPSSAWRILRTRAATAPSTKFTSHVVASMLNMASPKSAADNIVGPMRRLGLFMEDGGLTERGAKWRVDTSYDDACREILDEIYPGELAALTGSDGALDRSQVENWFQHHGFGGSNARQMAATYVMIAEKKIPESNSAEPKKAVPRARPKKTPPLVKKLENSENAQPPESKFPPDGSDRGPNIHLDIQIHIPAEAGPEQIDQIFASMAKHLYQR